MHGRDFKQSTTFNSRLMGIAQEARRRAGMLPLGEERDDLLRLAIQSENASHVEEWLRLPAAKGRVHQRGRS
jgi:hypothetical protein